MHIHAGAVVPHKLTQKFSETDACVGHQLFMSKFSTSSTPPTLDSIISYDYEYEFLLLQSYKT